jgi:nicotinamide-nucleotide amidase
MKILFVGIASEVLSGRICDTNGPLLGNFLARFGQFIHQSIIVQDEESEIKNCLEHACSVGDFDMIICSGGLGPTRDDMTKEVLSKTFDCPLEKSHEAEAVAMGNYSRKKKEWNADDTHFHIFPKGMIPLNNPVGLAPGIYHRAQNKMKKNTVSIFALPGVPREFEAILEDSFISMVTRDIPQMKDLSSIQKLTIRTYQLPEEKIFGSEHPTLWNDFSSLGKISCLPQMFGVDIIITLNEGINIDLAIEKARSLLEKENLLKNVWSFEDISLEKVIINLCREKKMSLSTAESCTGGLIAHGLTNIPGSSECFQGSAVTYSNELKVQLLGVKEETLENFGAVSLETAEEMSRGCAKNLKTNIAVATSGIAGPGGGSIDKPVGTVAISITMNNQTKSNLFHFNGTREELKIRFAKRALLEIYKLLSK